MINYGTHSDCVLEEVTICYQHLELSMSLKIHSECQLTTDAVFLADITHSMKFVSLNVIFLSFPIGCQFQFQILAHRWLDSSMLHSCSTSCT